jgi:lycopene cyclase domain-containing protein
MKYTYLVIDICSLLLPLVFTFHPKLRFYERWISFFPAMVITGMLFLAGDAWFTSLGVWGFNPKYITGIHIGNLPIEEILFFFCIPYACVFTFFSITPQIHAYSASAEKWQTNGLMALSIFLAIVANKHWYTCFAFSTAFLLIGLAYHVLKVTWLYKFYLVYLLLLIPFVVVNGLLTGTGLAEPIVWYNAKHILGIHILTIPVEDIFYGMDMVLTNLLFYAWFRRGIPNPTGFSRI